MLSVIFSGDLPKNLFQLDGTIITCWFSNIYVKSSFSSLRFILSVLLPRRFDTDISGIRILPGICFIWNSQFVSLLLIFPR